VNVLFRGQVVLAALASDISMGGLGLKAADALPLGSPCEVAIFLHQGENGERYVTRGTVVRNGEQGLAIRFAHVLDSKALAVIAKSTLPPAKTLWFQSYRDYFRVSQSRSEGECQRTFGISQRRFHVLTTASFLSCIPASLLPVWLLREHLPAVSTLAKIGLSFLYGAFWLLLLQPLVDLTLIRLLRRHGRMRSRTATKR
jgi:hypothetical protein